MMSMISSYEKHITEHIAGEINVGRGEQGKSNGQVVTEGISE